MKFTRIINFLRSAFKPKKYDVDADLHDANMRFKQSLEDHIVYDRIKILAKEQFDKYRYWDELGRKDNFIINSEYPHHYNVYHKETAKYIGVNIDEQIQITFWNLLHLSAY